MIDFDKLLTKLPWERVLGENGTIFLFGFKLMYVRTSARTLTCFAYDRSYVVLLYIVILNIFSQSFWAVICQNRLIKKIYKQKPRVIITKSKWILCFKNRIWIYLWTSIQGITNPWIRYLLLSSIYIIHIPLTKLNKKRPIQKNHLFTIDYACGHQRNLRV